ncbi:MAG: S41 family peptidase [Clostridia bacterium]|nr:S41 family peptidase [Clostridia bacterium]
MKNNEGFIKTAMTVLATAAVVFVATSSYYINNVVNGQSREKNSTLGNSKNNLITYNYSGDFDKLKKVLALINRDFLFEDYDMEKLEEGAIKGMLNSLDDPYTSYFNASETQSFLTETEGEYEGVGMYITFGTDIEWPMVLAPIKGSPAAEAGVKAGDYIYSISGEEIKSDTTLEEVATRLKGTSGTKVSVAFVRYDENKKQEKYTVELERRKIELSPFEYEVKDGNIGYIKFTSFDEDADVQFSKAYNELVNDKKVQGIIIDLRDNPGGLLDKVKKIADSLVPAGIITYTVDKNGNRKVEYSDKNQTSVPLVVLINENSASASEILSAAIKDHGVGKIVGKTSYGKGLVQEFVSLGDGTYVKVTIAEYFSPNGTKINKIGVVPDIEIDDNKDTEADEQLEKALEVIKNY